MKTLVVTYSKGGNTSAVGKEIAAQLSADTEEIREIGSRRGPLGFLRSGFEAFRGKKAEIRFPSKRPEDYDLVVVGTPIWAGRMSSPVRAYLEHYARSSSALAFFCTSGGGGYRRVLDEMGKLADRDPVATLELKQADLKSGQLSELVKPFTKKLHTSGS